MSAASVAVIYAEPEKTARAIVRFVGIFLPGRGEGLDRKAFRLGTTYPVMRLFRSALRRPPGGTRRDDGLTP